MGKATNIPTPERNISFHSNLPTNFRQSIFKMGVGRRMKKQGMPEPLDEAHFTNLKRKAGMSVTESRAESLQYASSKKEEEEFFGWRRGCGGESRKEEQNWKRICEREICQWRWTAVAEICAEEIEE